MSTPPNEATRDLGAEILREIGADALDGNWAWQYAVLREQGFNRQHFVVVRPTGSFRTSLVRKPLYTVAFMAHTGAAPGTGSDAAQKFVDAVREARRGDLTGAVASEPTFAGQTADGRLVFEVVVDLILSN